MGRLGPDSHGESAPRQRGVVDLAKRQHGVVARRQLLKLGCGAGAIDHWLAVGRLHVIHRGVYAVGRPGVDVRGRWLAAVLASGDEAVLSHRSAAILWGLLPGGNERTEITDPGRTRGGRPGIVVHRSRRLVADDRTMRDGIPVTTVARTLLDLAEVVERRRLRRAWDEAERLRLLDLAAIDRLRARSRGRHGLAALGALVAERRPPPAETRSELERLFLELCEKVGLSRPAVNVTVEGFEVDALWARERLVVELDGFEFHRSRQAFERDRERDMALGLVGYRVVRITYRRLTKDPDGVAASIRALLGAGAPTASGSR